MKNKIAVFSLMISFLLFFQAVFPINILASTETDSAFEEPSVSVTESVYEIHEMEPSINLNGIGARTEYFGDISFGDFRFARIEEEIDFNAGNFNSEQPLGNAYSIRWSGTVTPLHTEEYTFYLEARGGARLWIAGQLLIDSSNGNGMEKDEARIQLQANVPVTFKMEYATDKPAGVARLYWSSEHQNKEIVKKPFLNPPNIPDKPKNLQAVSIMSNSVHITWDPVQGASGYDVEADGNVIDVGASYQYQHEGLDSDTPHTYRVRSKVPGLVGEWSEALEVRTLIGVPNNLTTEIEQEDSIKLRWDAVNGAIGYEIEVDGSVLFVDLATEYVHAGLMPGTTHTYRVRALSASGRGDWSPAVSKTILPSIPTNLRAQAEISKIILSWDSVTFATGYQIEVDGEVKNIGNVTLYEHGNLTPNSLHQYRVRAIFAGGPGEWSPYKTVSTLQAMGTGIGLKGDYYNNTELKGTAVSRIDSYIDFDWKNNSPINGIDGKQYSVRWTGQIEPRFSETYTFTTDVHGGVRLWVDHKLLVDTWGSSNTNKKSGTISLQAGKRYDIQVEYLKPNGAAKVALYWQSASQPYELVPQNRLYPIGVPSALQSSPSEYSITIRWNPVTFASGYEIEADGVIMQAGNQTTFVHDSLIPGTLHSYRVRAVNGIAVGEWSAAVSEATLLGIPAITEMLAEETRVEIHWAAVPGADRYDIEVDGLIVSNGNQTAYVHEGLLPGTEHHYRVRALTDVRTGEWAPIVSKWTLPDVPANLRANSTSSSIELQWDSVVGAVNYEVEVYNTIIDVGDKTVYLDNQLNPNSQRTYRVRAVNSSGTGKWSPIFAKRTLPAPPGNLKGMATETSVYVSWDPASGAQKYELEVDGERLEVLNQTSYSHEGLASNTLHTYRVRSVGADGISDWSAEIKVMTLPAIPVGLRTTVDGNAIYVTWEPVTGDVSYELEINGEVTNTGLNTKFTVEPIDEDLEYVFRVRARNASVAGRWSYPVSAVAWPGIPTNIKAVAGIDEITLSWDPVQGAVSYEVEADGKVFMVAGTTFKHEALKPNTEHMYRVRALNVGGPGQWSQYVSARLKLEAPTLKVVSVTSQSIMLEWNLVEGAEKYELFIDGNLVDVGANTTYAHLQLEPYSVHIYRVRAKAGMNVSDWSETLSQLTGLAAPVNVTGQTDSESIRIRWDPVVGAKFYEIEVDGKILAQRTETTFLHTGLEPNTSHIYRIRALSDALASDWSVPLRLTTKPQIPVNIVAEAESRAIRLTWSHVPGATSYLVEADGNVVSVNTNAYLHESLQPNTMHVYRVAAVGTAGTSSWCEFVKAETSPELLIHVGQDTIFNFLVVVPAQPEKNQRMITVNYNPIELTVIDLVAQTPDIELLPGGVEGTNITVLSHESGKIIYFVDQTDKTFVNSIKFRANTNEYTKVIYDIE